VQTPLAKAADGVDCRWPETNVKEKLEKIRRRLEKRKASSKPPGGRMAGHPARTQVCMSANEHLGA
jgi:hypothetical protein